jgi:large subunit ribosomal protein L1
MSKNSKAYREAAEKVDKSRQYTPLEAVRLAKETSSKKQDATVEVAIRLGVDPRKADQMVRGTVNLPHGTGKIARVAVFAVGEKAEQAQAAGADIVGSDDLIEKIQGGFLDFDAAIAFVICKEGASAWYTSWSGRLIHVVIEWAGGGGCPGSRRS